MIRSYALAEEGMSLWAGIEIANVHARPSLSLSL